MQPTPKTPQDQIAPEWARWKAQDQDGAWHWFECRPRWNKRLGTWTSANGQAEFATKSFTNTTKEATK